jgi:hypothetical protein
MHSGESYYCQVRKGPARTKIGTWVPNMVHLKSDQTPIGQDQTFKSGFSGPEIRRPFMFEISDPEVRRLGWHYVS